MDTIFTEYNSLMKTVPKILMYEIFGVYSNNYLLGRMALGEFGFMMTFLYFYNPNYRPDHREHRGDKKQLSRKSYGT